MPKDLQRSPWYHKGVTSTSTVDAHHFLWGSMSDPNSGGFTNVKHQTESTTAEKAESKYGNMRGPSESFSDFYHSDMYSDMTEDNTKSKYLGYFYDSEQHQ